jgi:hypothetical protein
MAVIFLAAALRKGNPIMRKRYLIEISDSNQTTVYCPPSLLEGRNIKKLTFGSQSIEVNFISHPERKEKFVFGKNVAEMLYFPDYKIPLHVFIENQTLFIGPLVGIFTAGFTPISIRPIGERSLFFSKLLSVKQMVGALPFIFGEQHIDWDRGLIKGFFYHENGWEIHEVPFPNVIYDRLPNRRTENNSILRKVKERLQNDYLIPWYNPGFFNKLDVFNGLVQDRTVREYLPETQAFSSVLQVRELLSRHSHIYLKPINGSLGLGIHQIIYDEQDAAYYCRYSDSDGVNRLRKFATLDGLFNTVFGGKRLNSMLVQQGISLIKNEQRKIDFRVHTNKDDKGFWKVTAIAAKIAGPGSVTTHLKNGGVIKTPEEIFPPAESRDLCKTLSEAALLLSRSLEKNMEGIIGEIGFDLGVDRDGKVWLFEANSKPGRSIFSHPELKGFDLLTRKLSIAFAIYLTEQSIYYPEEIFK